MKNHQFYLYIDINTHISKFTMIQATHENIMSVIKLLTVVTCASNVLCDVINKGCELINTFFGEFLALFKEIQKNKEGL